jgi:hypothetical protein
MNAINNIENYIAFVKEQAEVQAKLVNRYAGEAYREGQHRRAEAKMRDLASFLQSLSDSDATPDENHRGKSAKKRIQLTLEDITGLPEELLREMGINETDKQELLIEFLISRAGGILSLDKIMIELYRRTQEIHKRNTLTSRLYRMVARGLIYNVHGKKGVYSTYEISEHDARRMFGSDESDAEATPAKDSPVRDTPQPETAPLPLREPLRRPVALRRDLLNSTRG